MELAYEVTPLCADTIDKVMVASASPKQSVNDTVHTLPVRSVIQKSNPETVYQQINKNCNPRDLKL